jgi:hypothetical protein
MRTDAEIIARMKSIEARDPFGFEFTDLLMRLPFVEAKPFLVDNEVEANWKQAARDRGALLQEMHEYMPFAWEKANNFRGLSAMRSLSHYRAWVWLAEHDDDALEIPTDYEFYGKDELVKICEHYGWDHTQWDDGVRANSEG